MAGLLCLQGGREFTDRCREMDSSFIRSTAAQGVGVLAGAARVGADYDGAVDRATRHYQQLGVDVEPIPDPRVDPEAALIAIKGVDLLVLPGGSPSSLLDVLTVVDDGSIGRLIVERWEHGTPISGASAGAMVMCSVMVRPERDDVVAGLGLVDGLALPHWHPTSDRDWPIPEGVGLWGLPECGGVIVDGSSVRAVGHEEPSHRDNGGVWSPVPR